MAPDEQLRDALRVLGLQPGCSWDQLLAAYRQLAKRWHPDRHQQHPERLKAAEDRFKAINQAFRQLSDYHRQHGRLPPLERPPPSARAAAQGPANTLRRPESQTGSRVRFSRPATPAPGHRIPRSRRPWLGPAVAVAITGWVAYRFWLQEAPGPAVQTTAPTASSAPTDGAADRRVAGASAQFTLGSTLGEVLAIHGPPSHVEGDTWHYGNSRVRFASGVVVAWSSDPFSPLRAPDDMVKTETAPRFTVGSTKAEVRAIEGAPLFESEKVWDYGVSKVYFEGGRVTHWQSSPLRPLRAR